MSHRDKFHEMWKVEAEQQHLALPILGSRVEHGAFLKLSQLVTYLLVRLCDLSGSQTHRNSRSSFWLFHSCTMSGVPAFPTHHSHHWNWRRRVLRNWSGFQSILKAFCSSSQVSVFPHSFHLSSFFLLQVQTYSLHQDCLISSHGCTMSNPCKSISQYVSPEVLLLWSYLIHKQNQLPL